MSKEESNIEGRNYGFKDLDWDYWHGDNIQEFNYPPECYHLVWPDDHFEYLSIYVETTFL